MSWPATMPPPAPPPLSPVSDAEPDGEVFPALAAALPRAAPYARAPVARKLRVLVLSSDTGGGHRASAHALQAALERLRPADVHVDVVDFWVQLAKGPGKTFPQGYAFLAKHPWMWKVVYDLTRFPPVRAFQEAWFNAFGHRKVKDAFVKYAPDLIVSVHPLVNTLSMHVLNCIERESGVPKVPYVTVVTDLGGAHPTWFHKQVDMTYVPNDAVRSVADRCNIAPTRLRQYGLPVRSAFWSPPRDKVELRQELGLEADVPAFLLIGGGDGIGNLGKIAKAIADRAAKQFGSHGAQLVVICGKNEGLRKSLSARNWRVPVKVLGYVNNMSEWMTACDVLCTKAGPGTIAEALIRGLPTLITGFLPGQEEDNVKYVTENGVGEFATRPSKIADIAARWIADPELRAAMSERARACGRPQASMEIAADIVEVAVVKTAQNNAAMERQRRLRSAQMALARSELLGMSASMAGTERPVLLDSSRESHLAFRLRVLLRVVFGSLIARDAFAHIAHTPDTSPVDSPVSGPGCDSLV